MPIRVIRLASIDDAAAARDLVQRAYGHYVERIGMRPGPMDDDYDAGARAGHLYVMGDGEVDALIVLVEEPGHLLIENVAVDPRHQGRGTGRELMEFAEETARDRGLPEIRLYTHRLMTENIAIYRHLGYEVTGERDEAGFGRVFLAKKLR